MDENKEMVDLVSYELKTLVHSAFLKEFRFNVFLSNGISFTNRDYFESFPEYRDALLEKGIFISEINLDIDKETLSECLIESMTFTKDCFGMSSASTTQDRYQSNLISMITFIEERAEMINDALKAVNTLDLVSRHIVICNQILSIPLRLLALQMDRQEETIRRRLHVALKNIAIKRNIAV